MQYRARVVPCLALTLLLGCGGDDGGDDGGGGDTPNTFAEACAEVPGCETPRVSVSATTEPVWRVLAVRDAEGDLRIEAVQETRVSTDVGLPPAPTGGDYAVAALDSDGQPVEVHPIRFPETMLLEGYDPLEDREEIDLSGEPSSAVGYLRVSEDVATLAVVEPPGDVIFSREAPAPGEAVIEPGPLGSRSEPLVQAAPGTACAHVMVLEGGWDEIWYHPALVERNPLRTVTPVQRAVVQAALGRLTPIHCAGVGRVAFAVLDSPTTGGTTRNWTGAHFGDLIVLNANFDFVGLGFDDFSLRNPIARAILTQSVIHEVGHATTYLFERAAGNQAFTGEWTPAARDLAGESVYRARIRGGLTANWSNMHASFERLGWARGYWGGDPSNTALKEQMKAADPATLVGWGFMSAYSANNVYDDIAETATWPLVAEDYRAAGAEPGPPPGVSDFACIVLGGHDAVSVPADMAAAYTKLAFVRDLGFIDEETFDACRGDRAGLPHDTEGIVVYQEGTRLRAFTTGPEASIGTRDGRYVFTLYVTGQANFGGETYDAGLDLELDLGPTTAGEQPVPIDDVSWPRGAYVLAPGEPHAFRLRMPDAPAGNFDVTDGFVLVASATNDRIVGSVVVREAFRFQAPIPVPEVYDPPLQFRFLLDN